MKALVIPKNNISNKASVKTFLKILDDENVKYEVIPFDEVDAFYDEIHKKNLKNSFDILISYGGDGTILKSARIARKLDIPILGINAGNIGFLTVINDLKNAKLAIQNIKKNKYLCEERSMLDVEIVRGNKKIFNSYAVNEATITSINICKMGKYKLLVGKEKKLFTEYSSDGIIVATPTGSTAHSLSMGGPIVSPDVNCFIITAIYPHTLNQRSIVISGNEDLYIEIQRDGQIVDIDGRIEFELKEKDIIKLSRLKKTVKYIIFEENSFLVNIKNKIKAI